MKKPVAISLIGFILIVTALFTLTTCEPPSLKQTISDIVERKLDLVSPGRRLVTA